MSRRARNDAVVVGGGVVGASCALALAACDLDVTLVEAAEPSRWTPDSADLRVYAFAPDSAVLLASFGVWSNVAAARAQPYRRMRVWDAAGGGELSFDADALGRAQLGWIVEHALLVDRLWAALSAAGVDVRTPARVAALEQSSDGVTLRLDDGGRIDARIAIAADGADSTLRALADGGVTTRDYGQRGVVAFVDTEHAHEDTAWQRFLPSGPIALLPFTNGRSSIVWTLPDARAAEVLALDDAGFADALTRASGARLGAVRTASARATFALRRQLVDGYVHGRVLMLGDAAHVVHPLAGQGVNLGLRDVAGLRDAVAGAQRRGRDWASPPALMRWARTRRSENALAAHALDAINTVYSSDGMLRTLLRGPLLGLAGRLPPVTAALWRRAAGI
ncbi:MAG: UbiH/UbiF family hydroxylase [Luteimonas sp.]